jgi:tRNA (guanine-N7-)-methyltransferase
LSSSSYDKGDGLHDDSRRHNSFKLRCDDAPFASCVEFEKMALLKQTFGDGRTQNEFRAMSEILLTSMTSNGDASSDRNCLSQKPAECAAAPSQQHNTKKPKWWLQLSRRRGTKGQRRTMAAMKHYILPPPRYGEFIDWNGIFPAKDITLEIGFGLGDNLLCNAQRHPKEAMVGADVHSPGTARVLKIIQQAQEQGRYWDGYSLYSQESNDMAKNDHHDDARNRQPAPCPNDKLYSNIRVYPGNGIKFLHSIPSSSLKAILLTFPDPFPLDSHAEFRIVQVSTVPDFYRALKDGGRLCLATDHEGYFEWCLNVMDQCRDLFSKVTPVPDRQEWLPIISKYEQKSLDEGRRTHLACWQVVGKKD